MEYGIRKEVTRYLALWIRERVAVVKPFSWVGVTFVPSRMEMSTIETLRKQLGYFFTSVLRANRLFHAYKF
jgi:hypothetical protein